MEGANGERGIDSASEKVGIVREWRKQRVWICTGKRAPVPRRSKEIERTRRECHTLIGRSVKVKVETQIVGRMQCEVYGTKLANGRPTVVIRKSRRKVGGYSCDV